MSDVVPLPNTIVRDMVAIITLFNQLYVMDIIDDDGRMYPQFRLQATEGYAIYIYYIHIHTNRSRT